MALRIASWTIGLLMILAPTVRGREPQQPSSARGERQREHQGAGQEGGRGLIGKITAVRKDSIQISRPDGTTVTVKITDQTQFRKDRQDAKLSDLKADDWVFVRGEENADHSLTASLVGTRTGAGPGGGAGSPGGSGGPMGTMGKDFVAGEVKEVNAPKITVLRADNVTQTIELNEETSLRKGQESITLADLQVGDHIFARGAVQDDVFVPKMVMVATAEQWKRMQEMGMAGQGRAPKQKDGARPPKPQEPPQ